jgi:DtxR family transcriptional regulator, Mn-dependent transcriptional regulator
LNLRPCNRNTVCSVRLGKEGVLVYTNAADDLCYLVRTSFILAPPPPRSFRHEAADDALLTPVERNYLEVIAYLSMRPEAVIAARLARWLRVRPPTVTATLQQLSAKGYILRTISGAIIFTPTGAALADMIVRRHRLLERFLHDVLGIPWHQLHQEAVRLEPALSPSFLAYIETCVGAATHCPHGNPISGSSTLLPTDELRLDVAPIGVQFTVTRIDEEAGEDPCMLQRFWISGLLPQTMCVRLLDPRDRIALRIDGRRIVLSRRVAALVWGTAVTV